jgi:outer membrane lipopolysaccharide assembly protein LptE/RlpB
MNRDVWAAIAATVAVVVVAALGFHVLGSPASQRLVQRDSHAVHTLAELAQQINGKWSTGNRMLPTDLEKFPSSVKQDPVSGKQFIYHVKSKDEYELCATFATDNREMPAAGTPDRWIHPKGDFCFQFQASESVPIPWVPYSY